MRRPLNKDTKGREGAYQDVSGRQHIRRIEKYRIPTGRVYLWCLRNGERFGGAETERAKEKGTEEESQRKKVKKAYGGLQGPISSATLSHSLSFVPL